MAKTGKAATTIHNDIDELPPDEPAQEFDEESPSDVLGIDVGEPKGNAKATPKDEPDERPGQEVLDEVAREAADDSSDEETDEKAEEPTTEEGATAPADEQRRTIQFERDGEIVELEVSDDQFKFLEAFKQAADVTRSKYTQLQGTHYEALQRLQNLQSGAHPAPGGAPGAQPAPEEQADARLNQMLEQIPRLVQAYSPVLEGVKKRIPDDSPLAEVRDFIDDQPVLASIITSLVDGHSALASFTAETQAERAQSAFRNHVDSLVNNIIQSDSTNEALADPSVRDQFDAYLVTLGPIGRDGQHDPTPVRAALMQDDGRWLAARWSDFQLRAALAGAKPAGGSSEPATKPKIDESRRRAIDPGGSSRSGSRPRSDKSVYSREVLDVLTPD